MDDYQREINELQVQVDAMIEAEENPKEITELRMQLEILRALYAQATALHEAGRLDLELRRGLALKGYGEWTLDNVYAFVYETSVDLPAEGHHSFVGEIHETDFAGMLG